MNGVAEEQMVQVFESVKQFTFMPITWKLMYVGVLVGDWCGCGSQDL